MQYVEGRNLSEVLSRDGRLGPERAARIALEICIQLDKFHTFRPGDGAAAVVVHGDIKPSNIHLGPNETVRLLDFGIAKTLRPDRDSTIHQFGSPSYCSPERLGRSLVDAQADLWAVGATLYEMLAGAPPYQAENTRKLEKLIQSRRPPRALPAACPPAIKAIASKSLAPDAARRYPSAAAFAHDLQAFLDGAETVAEKEKRGAWKPNPTLESGRASNEPKVRRRLPRRFRRAAFRFVASLACILTGMFLFVATSYAWRYWTGTRQLRATLDWSVYQDLDAQFAFLGPYSPVAQLRAPLRAAYLKAGAQFGFGWPKTEAALEHAVALGANDPATLAHLALARGYVALNVQKPEARDRFAEAARDLPAWPDPHVALAMAWLASPPDLDRALAEIQLAEHLGYTPQAREIEPIAGAYRLRGFQELEEDNLAAARRDFDTTRTLYSSVPSLNYRLHQVPDLPPPAPARPHRRSRTRRR